jgi:hypothetical protein
VSGGGTEPAGPVPPPIMCGWLDQLTLNPNDGRSESLWVDGERSLAPLPWDGPVASVLQAVPKSAVVSATALRTARGEKRMRNMRHLREMDSGRTGREPSAASECCLFKNAWDRAESAHEACATPGDDHGRGGEAQAWVGGS